MTVISSMPSFVCERQGLLADAVELVLAIQAKLKGLCYGG